MTFYFKPLFLFLLWLYATYRLYTWKVSEILVHNLIGNVIIDSEIEN